MGYIYLITNKINGSIYVGKTVDTIQSRWRDHVSSANTNADNYYIHNAIKKYGEENFQIELLEECENSLLSEREKYWIKEKNSFYHVILVIHFLIVLILAILKLSIHQSYQQLDSNLHLLVYHLLIRLFVYTRLLF